MSAQHSLEQQVHALQQENQALRAELAKIEQRAQIAREAKARVIRIGWRVLVPLLDRQKVVRSFAKLLNNATGFTGPRESWPTQESLLQDARTFLESCVRFVIRRRMFLLLFSLVAATIPAIQMYLVVQQNQIIENQNKFFEIQTYDIMVKALTDDDPERSRANGALMANVDLEFMAGAVGEVFDTEQEGFALRREDLDDRDLQYRQAGLRSSFVRAAARGVRQRGRQGMDTDELYTTSRPMFRAIAADAASRLPLILRLGGTGFDNDEEKKALYYISQIGYMLRVYGRLSRAVDERKQFFADIKPLFTELARSRSVAQSRFAEVYRTAFGDFLFDLAVESKFGAQAVTLNGTGLTPEQALSKGIERLRAGLGDDALDWKQFEAQVAGP